MPVSDTIKLSDPGTKGFWEIPVVYEDEQLLAVNKPPLLLSSPDRYDRERPNLMRLLHRGIESGAPWAKARGLTYLMNSHRLDFETSGVMLLAKSKPVLVALADLFGAEKPVKIYVALVHGRPSDERFSVDARLAAHPTKPGVVRVEEKGGKRSQTVFLIRERFGGFTLLECQPLTGRTHQIRVHLKHAGYPIVGDQRYGGRVLFLSSFKSNYRLKPKQTERPLLEHTALHAEQLRFLHPSTGREVAISAPWGKDLSVAVKYLRRLAPDSGSPVSVSPVSVQEPEQADNPGT